ncbi:MAG: lipid-A-disaccharide synthase [Pseudomonadales bacterium]|nr:lipid-A-disaccharide synthase [Pseudomonadales bacterium]
MSKAIRFGIVVGEASGDSLGAGLMTALRQLYPDAEFTGIGGPKMEALGCRSLAPMERLAVMGFVEPLGRLPELFRIKKQLQEHFIEDPPDAFIGIDAPDFNLRLEKPLREAGIATVHYVSPSVWAYREKRITGIKAAVDLMLTLFPFETAIYQEHDIAVRCVGHPLADSIGFDDQRQQARQSLSLSEQEPVLALMPGSRSGEIKRLGPDFIGAAIEARQYIPRLRVLIPCANQEARFQLQGLLRQANLLDADDFLLLDNAQDAISAADLVLLASGTATLETMLLRRPMIVCYRLAPLTYWLASRMVKIPHVALPNLLAGKELVPELIQDQVSVPAIRDLLVAHFHKPRAEQALLEEFDQLHKLLRRDASRSAAEAVRELVEKRRGVAADG